MAPDSTLRPLLDALLRAATFEDAGEALLARLPPDAGAFGALVYRRLGSAADIVTREASPAVLSGTCWREVRARGVPVHLALEERAITLGEGAGAARGGRVAEFRSREVLRQQDLAALSALPLRRAGEVLGMLLLAHATVDVRGWRASLADLGLLADVAAPVLLALPRRAPSDARPDPLIPVVGRAMTSVLADLARYAAQEETILLTGPTGVGKTRLARWCHERSHRRGGPFVVANLATLQPELLPGHLFGWRRGAFTGADQAHVGWVAEARGGTLFLDEIGRLDLTMQGKLLRLLDEGIFRPLGGRDEESDARIVVGTNLDLARATREGTFLEDLYYRIDVLQVALPRLDERADEIAGWARIFAAEGGVHLELQPDVARLLEQAPWPGNLRQLHNVVRRAVALSDGSVVTVNNIRRALGAPGLNSGEALVPLMTRAARRFLDHVEAGTLAFPDANTFASLVIQEAVHRHGEREGLERLGRAHSFAGNNQRKLLNREAKRVRELEARAVEVDLAGTRRNMRT